MRWELSASTPIWQQLHDQLALRIATGAYPPGSRMPTVRELAAEAGVNPNTMQRALAKLEDEGLAVANRTAGRTVSEDEMALCALRLRLANARIAEYLRSMASLGFERARAIELLQEWKEEITCQQN